MEVSLGDRAVAASGTRSDGLADRGHGWGRVAERALAGGAAAAAAVRSGSGTGLPGAAASADEEAPAAGPASPLLGRGSAQVYVSPSSSSSAPSSLSPHPGHLRAGAYGAPLAHPPPPSARLASRVPFPPRSAPSLRTWQWRLGTLVVASTCVSLFLGSAVGFGAACYATGCDVSSLAVLGQRMGGAATGSGGGGTEGAATSGSGSSSSSTSSSGSRASPVDPSLTLLASPPWGPVSRIAFGSCTSYDAYTPQSVWTRGVIPYDPDVWIWEGDMAYADEPAFNCEGAPDAPACTCKPGYLRQPPNSCLAGDEDNARDKFAAQLAQPGYGDFLDHMCPHHAGNATGSDATGSSSSAASSSAASSSSASDSSLIAASSFSSHRIVPQGDSPRACPRPVLGTYDDHDAGWNNGNARLPRRHALKQIFLDAIGVSRDSPRRLANRGIEWRYRLNADRPDRAVDVILLDERYDRDTLPCASRRRWCERKVLDPSRKQHTTKYDRAWCADFVSDPSPDGTPGSCCRLDEWAERACGTGAGVSTGGTQADGGKLPADDPERIRRAKEILGDDYAALCDPTSPRFGSIGAIRLRDGSFERDPGAPGAAVGAGAPPGAARAGTLDPKARRVRSGACDMLSPNQRDWLRLALEDAKDSPLTLLVSGSVLVGNPHRENTKDTQYKGLGSGDDWDCYPRAQRALFAQIDKRPGDGCLVVVTGDYHQSDIKVIPAGKGGKVRERYGEFTRPLYQVMASGLTNSTARPHSKCEEWRVDHAGLRPGGRCAYVARAAFGAVTVDWEANRASLEIRAAEEGRWPVQRLNISLATCQVQSYEHHDY